MMARWQKILLIILSILSMGLFLSVMFLFGPLTMIRYVPPITMQHMSFYPYLIEFLFWGSGILLVLSVIVLLVIIFAPRKKPEILLKEDRGRLVLHKKAIEGCVRSVVDLDDLMNHPTVKVSTTKRRIKIKIVGSIKRTGNLLGRTDELAEQIRQDLMNLLGIDKEINVHVAFKELSSDTKKNNRRVV